MGRAARRVHEKRERVSSLDRQQTRPAKSLQSWLYVAVFVVALTTRWLVSGSLADLGIARVPWLDSAEYLDWARRLASGGWLWPVNPPHGPGYPLFLALPSALWGDSLQTIRFVQAVVGSVGCVLTASVAARLLGRRSALVAGLAQALYGPLVLTDVSILAEGLLVASLLVSLYCTVGRDRIAWSVGGGLALGLASITRATAVLFAPAFLLARLTTGSRRQRLIGTAAFVLSATIVVFPVTVKNWAVSGTPMIQSFGGLNFYIGNSPRGTGLASARPGAGWQSLNSEAERHGATTGFAQDRYYIAKTFREISENPAGYVRLVLSKAVWTVQAEEVRDTHSYAFFASQSTILRWLPGFGLVFPFAVIGILAPLWRRSLPAAMYLWLGGGGITCVAFVVGTRYRLPTVPVLVIFGALGVEVLLSLLRRNGGRAITFERVLAGALFLIGITCSQLWLDPATHSFAEEWVYTGKSLEAEGRLLDAEAAYRRAVQADARSEYGWDRLGALLLQSGRRQEGRDALANALRIAPAYPDAAYHLGLVEEQEKNFEEAVRYFQRAAASSPGALNYQQALARTLVSAGRYEDAEKLYSELTARFPKDASSHVGLAFLLNTRGESAKGASEARRAVALDPANEMGWLLVARTAIDVEDHAAAEAAIGRIRSLLGPNRPEVRYLEEELARAKGTIAPSRR